MLKELPVHHKIVFHHEVYNESGDLLNTGEITLYFMEAATLKRCPMPEDLHRLLQPYFNRE
jgi:acyl-CoA thioester hydrolase